MVVAAARTRQVIVAVLVALALTAGVLAFVVISAGVSQPTESVFLEARTAVGASPFVRPVAQSEPAGEQSDQSGQPDQAVPDQAGSGDLATCDPAQLIAYLTSHPDAASAWVDALNSDGTLKWSGGDQIAVEQIPTYIGELTPVVLSEDSRVTNFQFVDGRASGVQSVLQSGTAVLVDGDGVPRVRCACGNPLTPMRQITSPVTYDGEPWSGFTPIQITIIVDDDDPECDDNEYWDGDNCRPYRYCPDNMYLGQDGSCYFPGDPCPPTWRSDDGGRCYDPDPEYCPDGSVMRPGKECRKPVDCPDGYEQRDSKCVKPHPCPPDQRWDGDECQPKPACPDGKHRGDDGKCTDGPGDRCPDGKAKADGQPCTDPVGTCPGGKPKVDGKCVPPGDTCSDGKAKADGQECTAPPGDTCADGKAKTDGQQCTNRVGTCPGGEPMVDGQCLPTGSTCPDGKAKVDGQQCATAPETCPDGKARVDGQQCATAPVTCPDGKARVDGQQCATAPLTCPDGSPKVADKKCPDTPVVDRCPDGTAKQAGGTCPPATKCPPGQVEQGGVCFACLGPPPDRCGPSEQGAKAQQPAAPAVAPPPAATPAPPVVAPKPSVAPKAPKAVPLQCPDGTTAVATVGCPVPASGVPTGWVQRGKTMFPAPTG